MMSSFRLNYMVYIIVQISPENWIKFRDSSYIDNNNNLYGCGNGTNGQQGTGTSYGTYVLTFTEKG